MKIGDIIVFRTFGTTDTGQHELIVHRVVQIVNDTNGQRIIRAKGDAIDSSIPSAVFGLGRQVSGTYCLICFDKDQSACLFSFANFFISDSFIKNVKMAPLHSVMDFSVYH